MNMEDSIVSVEAILKYTFKDKKLLEEALTHSSYAESPSYKRLEFIGDAALGHAIANFFYLEYPYVGQGLLTDLRAANVSAEKFARVSVHHGLYKYIRHKAPDLYNKVREFVMVVEEEEGMVVHGGVVKAPDVLADIVESIAAAVNVDCGFNLKTLWMTMREILEPLVMLDDLEKQPVRMLYEACQKDKKCLDIQHQKNGKKTIARVYVDGQLIASVSSENKDNARLHAAKDALSKITESKRGDPTGPHTSGDFSEATEIEGANGKQKLHELCNKKRWPKPIYNLEKELGPAHDKRYISSIKVDVPEMNFSMIGDERTRVKDAENSAASRMFHALREAGYV